MAAGVALGLLAALALAPATGSALGGLAKARAQRAEVAGAIAASKAPVAPLVAPGLATPDAAALAGRIRALAKNGGVLAEQVEPAGGSGALIAVRVRLSGPEKAVVALADALEREAPLVRLRGWRLVPIAGGGLRLSGEAVAVRR